MPAESGDTSRSESGRILKNPQERLKIKDVLVAVQLAIETIEKIQAVQGSKNNANGDDFRDIYLTMLRVAQLLVDYPHDRQPADKDSRRDLSEIRTQLIFLSRGWGKLRGKHPKLVAQVEKSATERGGLIPTAVRVSVTVIRGIFTGLLGKPRE